MTATRMDTTREAIAAFQAVILRAPSRTKRVMSGSIATRAVSRSDPPTASRIGLYMNTSLYSVGDVVFGW